MEEKISYPEDAEASLPHIQEHHPCHSNPPQHRHEVGRGMYSLKFIFLNQFWGGLSKNSSTTDPTQSLLLN